MKNHLMTFILFLLCITSNVFAADVQPLRPDEAFVFSTTIPSAHQVNLEWKMQPTYYLYSTSIHATFTPSVASSIALPDGTQKMTQTHGSVVVYHDKVIVPVALKGDHPKHLKMQVTYQGCSSSGFCYPPMKKMVDLDFSNITPSTLTTDTKPTSLQSLLTNQNEIRQLFNGQHIALMLFLFTILGLLLAFTPCVLPMIPILTAIIVGQKHQVGTRKAFLLSLTYVLGVAITYALAGLVAASLGNSVQAWLQMKWVVMAVALLFLFLGLSMFGFFELRMPHRLHNRISAWSAKHEGGTYVGVFFMGILSTLIVSPCVTAPLVGVLIYIGETGNLILGASALFAMGIGMGMPLLLIGMSAGKWLPKSGPWMTTIKAIFGILMIAMAIWLLSRVMSYHMTRLLWGVFVMGVAAFFAMYVPRHIGQYRFNRGLGFIIGVFGVMVLLGAMGVSTVLDRWIGMAPASMQTPRPFIIVHSTSDLDKQLAAAHAARRPVILDFYADWCESCVSMDKRVFSSPEVRADLRNFILLRADLTENSAADEALLKRFNVVAPPTVLFFSPAGKENNLQRIVGEVDAIQFINRLNDFKSASCDKNIRC